MDRTVQDRKPFPDCNRALLVIAHPDDEIFSFGGAILGPLRKKCDIICMTDGNYHGFGERRKAAFFECCKNAGVNEARILEYQDDPFFRFPIEEIVSQLQELDTKYNYDLILTHAPTGEYGHVNHMDTCLATHEAFSMKKTVLSLGYQTFADHAVFMSKAVYLEKFKLAIQHYPNEIKNGFWRDYGPMCSVEFYNQVDLKTIRTIVNYLSDRDGELSSLENGPFGHLIPLLESQKLFS